MGASPLQVNLIPRLTVENLIGWQHRDILKLPRSASSLVAVAKRGGDPPSAPPGVTVYESISFAGEPSDARRPRKAWSPTSQGAAPRQLFSSHAQNFQPIPQDGIGR